jgi:hypothetical protein
MWFRIEPTSGPVTDTLQGEYRIFPWAILTWTTQVYFFSAIIERVLGGGKD